MSTVIAASVTDVGKVREHNEDGHLVDTEAQIFIVADGMGGHAAGEVASAMAVANARKYWSSDSMQLCKQAFLSGATNSRRNLVRAVRKGVVDAHLEIVQAAQDDPKKKGMGTTFTGFLIAGGSAVFAHAGDSRAYLLRDEINIQLSEDHTLLARLHASGVDLKAEGGDTARYAGVLTNALGIGGGATKVATFIISLYDGDKIMLCSDGVYQYLDEAEIGEVLAQVQSPSEASRKLVDMALDRGGEDNATAVVVEVTAAAQVAIAPEQRMRDDEAIAGCSLFRDLSPQERLRALRITTPRDLKEGATISAVALGERVAYVLLEGEVTIAGCAFGPGALIYAEALIDGTVMPDRSMTAKAKSAVRLLTIRRDDFFELTEDESDLGVKMYAVLAKLMAS